MGFYDKVANRIGYDFSKIKIKQVVKTWNYEEVTAKYLKDMLNILDIGCGDGLFLIKNSNKFKNGYGIDSSRNMIKCANKNLEKSKKKNIKFKIASAYRLPFKNSTFDIVMCRQAPYGAKEVYRVLKQNGVFIFQHIGNKDKQNLVNIFGRGQMYKIKEDKLKKNKKRLENVKFRILETKEKNPTEYYKTEDDLIFLLKNTPIVKNFNIKKDKRHLEKFINKYKTKEGIKTNTHRFLIVAKKII